MVHTGRLHIPEAEVIEFAPVLVFFTVDGREASNPGSAHVLRAIEAWSAASDAYRNAGIRCLAFGSPAEVEAYWRENESLRERSVALYDGAPRNEFSRHQLGSRDRPGPSWAKGVIWGIEVNAGKVTQRTRSDRCAHSALAHFHRKLRAQLEIGNYPWGVPKKGSHGPGDVVRIDMKRLGEVLGALQRGPDLAKAIAAKSFAGELPAGSRISWVRIPPGVLGYSGPLMQQVVSATRRFEEACGKLVLENAAVRDTILSGVTIPDERLRAVYVDPGVSRFSVTRPDIHYNPDCVNASEIDEMPGGMPELVHIDAAYGVNQEQWPKFFDWLTREGPLVFVVSHDWSECYVEETQWLVDHLKEKGYDAHLLGTDQLERLSITDDGAYLDSMRIGTAWRQFPIFEATGKLADLVLASRQGKVRLVPEFAHFGNKAWFHLFRQHRNWFEANLEPAVFDLLWQILPDSHFVDGPDSFPCTVGGVRFDSYEALSALPQEGRDNFVLKVCGANELSARSYGVLMGDGIKAAQWREWVKARKHQEEPFLVQARFRNGVIRMPVWNAAHGRAEMFSCQLLMRPWAYGDDDTVVAVHGCAVPSHLHRVHGMTAMAVTPVELLDRVA